MGRNLIGPRVAKVFFQILLFPTFLYSLTIQASREVEYQRTDAWLPTCNKKDLLNNSDGRDRILSILEGFKAINGNIEPKPNRPYISGLPVGCYPTLGYFGPYTSFDVFTSNAMQFISGNDQLPGFVNIWCNHTTTQEFFIGNRQNIRLVTDPSSLYNGLSQSYVFNCGNPARLKSEPITSYYTLFRNVSTSPDGTDLEFIELFGDLVSLQQERVLVDVTVGKEGPTAYAQQVFLTLFYRQDEGEWKEVADVRQWAQINRKSDERVSSSFVYKGPTYDNDIKNLSIHTMLPPDSEVKAVLGIKVESQNRTNPINSDFNNIVGVKIYHAKLTIGECIAGHQTTNPCGHTQ